MTSLSIPSGKESEDLPYLYWTPKLHHLIASWSLNTDLGRQLTQFLSL
jgi:hypothetical protein